MRIIHNTSATNTYNSYTGTLGKLGKSTRKLSTGYRVNTAADDAAGLAISEKMRAQIKGLDMAAKNVQDGLSLVETAEGALGTTHAILQRMRELSVQSASDTNQEKVDREALDLEFQQLIKEIDDIATKTVFNGRTLINGDFKTTCLVIQTGANAKDELGITLPQLSSTALTLNASNIKTRAGATAALKAIDTAVNKVSMTRARLGALANRLEYKHDNLVTSSENLQSAESRIRDLDMAKEMSNNVNTNVRLQAATAMLSQANMQTQNVLSLLR